MDPPRIRFSKKQKLVHKVDFDRVFEIGRVGSNETLVIHAILRGEGGTRLGISISKRVGNAPQRNRWKRLIRESFRLQQRELPAGMDIVVRPKRGALADFRKVYDSIPFLLHRLHRQLSQRRDG